ncbi:RDD family [Popillia japonica]|uniref:RDD family n=1 Tax=Popillia japonica TaxID=7064 RepID=A0AAW1NJC4_POPJA
MQEEKPSGAKLTLNELNQYFVELKAWLDNARAVQTVQQQSFERELNVQGPLQESVYRHLGYTLYAIPPLWKRLLAEAVDFAILFGFKLYLTFIVFHNLEFAVDDGDEFLSLLEDPQKAMEMSTGLAVLEIVYRAIACLYETYFLYNGQPATPGKILLGLRVVCISDVIEVDQQHRFLYLYPASRPNLKVAFCRAVVKNVLLGVVMFPMCFGMFISRYKRTVYDLLVGTIVVEHRGPVRAPNN